MSFNSHTTTAERRAKKQRQRRGASSSQKTKRGIEGENPAAAGREVHLPERSSRSCFGLQRRCPCPGSVPCGAADWPAAGGMANGVVRQALAKSR